MKNNYVEGKKNYFISKDGSDGSPEYRFMVLLGHEEDCADDSDEMPEGIVEEFFDILSSIFNKTNVEQACLEGACFIINNFDGTLGDVDDEIKRLESSDTKGWVRKRFYFEKGKGL